MDDPFVSGRWERRPRAQSWLSQSVPTPHTSDSSHSFGHRICWAPAVWTMLHRFKSLRNMNENKERRQPTEYREEATVDRRRMSTGWKAQMQGDPTGQGAARWPKGRTWTLTDDPCKETKLQGPAGRQGPPEAGRTDAWQVRTPEKHLWHSRWLQPDSGPFPLKSKQTVKPSK